MMGVAIGAEFAGRVAAVDVTLARVSEKEAQGAGRASGWSRKEELGHLLDSAANNRVRFAFAALGGEYEGPSYDQPGWVGLHGYAGLSWSELLGHWRSANGLLTRLVANIPEAALEGVCRVGAYEPMTLRALIIDYLVHLEHHAAQIASGLA